MFYHFTGRRGRDLTQRYVEIHSSTFLFSSFKHYELVMVTDQHLKNQWNGRQCRLFESPAEASPLSCDVDHVVDDVGVFGGIAIGFASFGTSIG